MSEVLHIKLLTAASTAAALPDDKRRAAVRRLVACLVRPGIDDPLVALFERTAESAREAGLTEAKIERELAAYDAERST